MKRVYLIMLALSVFSHFGAQAKDSRSGFIELNLYPYLSDVKNDNVVTVNVFSTLPNRLSYFSLTNFINQSDRNALDETSAYYTEQNIRWKMTSTSPFDLTMQAVLKSTDNDALRFGLRCRFHDVSLFQDFFSSLGLRYMINVHAVQVDHDPEYAWQIEHVFIASFPKDSNRFYLSGFVDHNIKNGTESTPRNPIVSEIQLGARTIGKLYVIVEYRINEFRQSDTTNWAAGLEYKIKW